MSKTEGVIFDMDGSLYSFDNGTSLVFERSKFGSDIHDLAVGFFANQFGVDENEALTLYRDFQTRYDGEVSLGLEQEFDIPRAHYFEKTWDLNPANYIRQDPELAGALSSIETRKCILSAAPKVWVDRVLSHLGVLSIFEGEIYTGDPNIRKPDTRVFQQIADAWETPADRIVSIGDQELTDILPAKKIGMKTIRIAHETASTAADYKVPHIAAAIALLHQEQLV